MRLHSNHLRRPDVVCLHWTFSAMSYFTKRSFLTNLSEPTCSLQKYTPEACFDGVYSTWYDPASFLSSIRVSIVCPSALKIVSLTCSWRGTEKRIVVLGLNGLG